MAERRIAKAADFTSSIRTNDGPIYTYIGSNPGSTVDDIATGTALSQLIVDQVLNFGVKSHTLASEEDYGGVTRYWQAEDLAALVKTHYSTARTWLSGIGSSGALESSLKADLETAGVSATESAALSRILADLLVNEIAAGITG